MLRCRAFLPVFENAISHQRQTLVNQAEKSKSNQDTARKARLYITHFPEGHEYGHCQGRAASRKQDHFTGSPRMIPPLPSLTTENELVAWGKTDH
ncbi:MAG: hypothetical protein MZV63_10485 [Marinilabiliales bacterium]|nr:hypothetical protein [Marinilabiliales bacterium]